MLIMLYLSQSACNSAISTKRITVKRLNYINFVDRRALYGAKLQDKFTTQFNPSMLSPRSVPELFQQQQKNAPDEYRFQSPLERVDRC